MAESEVEYLNDQVQRLNSMLAQYQSRYPPIGINPGNEQDLPWVTDASLNSPLMVEYDAQIHFLQSQVEKYKKDHHELRLQMDKLVSENSRLSKELMESVQLQMENSSYDGLQPTSDDDQLLKNVESQLQITLEEKASAVEMWQAASMEVDRLEYELQNQKGINPRIQQLQETADRIKDQYAKTVSELNNEMKILQIELNCTKNELKASNIQVKELKNTLEGMKNQLFRRENDYAVAEEEGMMTGGKLSELQKATKELQNKLGDSNRELNSFKKEKLSFEERVLELQKKLTDTEAKEVDAFMHYNESLALVEKAMLEKDQAIIREKQALDQVARMEEAITKLVDETGARTRQEVDSVKKHCNDNITRLMEELHAVEMECSEKKAQIDRIMREKRAVESELEKLYREGLVQSTKDGATREELIKRACDAERQKEEIGIKHESQQSEMQRFKMVHQQEKSKLETEIANRKKRVEGMSKEFEEMNAERVKLAEEVDGMKKIIQALKNERDSAKRNLTKETSCLELDMKMREQSFNAKLSGLEEAHRSVVNELRLTLTSQQRMSAKWKEECNTITRKFEVKVTDLRSDVSRYKKKCEELKKLLRESTEKNVEAEQMLSEYGRNIKHMEDRVRDAENQAATSSLQVSKQLSKARQMFQSTTHSSFSHMQHTFANSNQSKNSGEPPEMLRVSDLITKETLNSQLPEKFDYLNRR